MKFFKSFSLLRFFLRFSLSLFVCLLSLILEIIENTTNVIINATLSKKVRPITLFHRSGKLLNAILSNIDSGRNKIIPVSNAIATKAGVIFLKLSNVFSDMLSTEMLIVIFFLSSSLEISVVLSQAFS